MRTREQLRRFERKRARRRRRLGGRSPAQAASREQLQVERVLFGEQQLKRLRSKALGKLRKVKPRKRDRSRSYNRGGPTLVRAGTRKDGAPLLRQEWPK